MSGNDNQSKVKRLAAALFVTTALSTITLNSPAHAEYSFDQAYDAYASSGYNYCDAKLVGMLWNEDVTSGKATIGHKILNGIGSNIPLILTESRAAQNKCQWEDTGYSYDDAVALANAWNIGSVADAKWTIATKMTDGYSDLLRQTLGH